jgi:hypothetical protein
VTAITRENYEHIRALNKWCEVPAVDASMPFAREAVTVTFEMFSDVHRDAGGTRLGAPLGK